MSPDIISDLTDLIPSLEVYPKSSPGYQKFREYYNTSLPEQPLAIVRPRTEDEVSQAVRYCTFQTQRIPIAIRSGGHDFFGRSLAHDGIVIDMRTMDSVHIAADKKSARIGGGVVSGTLQKELERHQLFTPTGQNKGVGYTSWATGGGYGFWVGSHGFGVDQILGARVVVASGKVVDTESDKDLLWALRGSGAGNWGVVVELRIKVYPIPRIYSGNICYPLSEAEQVFEGLQRIRETEGWADELSADSLVAHSDLLPEPVTEPCFTYLFAWTATDGNIEPAKPYLDKMLGLGTVLLNTVTEIKATEFEVGNTSGATFFLGSNVRSLTPEIGSILARLPPPQPLSIIVIHDTHGKGIRKPIADGIGASFMNRHPHAVLGYHGGTRTQDGVYGNGDAAVVATSMRWAVQLEREIGNSEAALKGGYPHFVPPRQVDDVEFFGLEGAKRLRALKGRIDPGGAFSNKGLMGLSWAKSRL